MKKARLILVDDHKMFLDGLTTILNTSGEYEIVLKSNDAAQVEKFMAINEDACHVLITDINMPGMDGIALNAHVKKHHPNIKVMVVSMRHDAKTIHQLTKDGVDGTYPKMPKWMN